MANDNNELKNNAPCEEKQEARELTPEELEQVTGGWIAAIKSAGAQFASVTEGKPGDNGFQSVR